MKKTKKKINWKILIFSFVFVHIAAFIGSRFTNTGGWYDSIKPSITPPNFVFPIVWTILFILISLALYFAYSGAKERERRTVLLAFGLNLVLNALWSYFFFGLQNPIAAFYEIILLWLSILLMMVVSWKTSRLAYYFLIPYLLWVSFAIVLNYLIVFG